MFNDTICNLINFYVRILIYDYKYLIFNFFKNYSCKTYVFYILNNFL